MVNGTIWADGGQEVLQKHKPFLGVRGAIQFGDGAEELPTEMKAVLLRWEVSARDQSMTDEKYLCFLKVSISSK
jgi:hypothetical protein